MISNTFFRQKILKSFFGCTFAKKNVMNKQYFFKIVIVLCIITFTQIRVTEQKLKDFQCDYGWYVLPENSNYSISGVYFVRCNNEVEKIVKIK